MSTRQTRDLSEDALTRAAVASFGGAGSGRFRVLAESLVRHLHAFVEDVQLTEEEWFAAIDFLTRTGDITTETRQEFILLSDVLGVSMLVVGINNRTPPEATQATVFGPFFVEDSPRFANGEDLGRGAPGQPCFMHGRVLAVDGTPVAGARIDVWQADESGFYDVQYDALDGARGRGHLFSEDDGRWSFWSVRPEAYPIPTDGPVGELLGAANRSPMRPAHVHFKVTADGYETLITHVFVAGDPYLDSDAVFGVKDDLITEFSLLGPGPAPDGTQRDAPYCTMTYDLVLAPRGDEAPDEHRS